MGVKHLSFTGQSGCYAVLPLSVLPGATVFTIEVEFSTKSTKNNTYNWTWGTIAGREIDGNWRDDFGLCVNNGKLCFWAEPVARNSLYSSTGGVFSNAVVNDGSLHKVAVVSSNSAIYLYCDGQLVANVANVNAKTPTNYSIMLAYDGNANSYLQMDLFEARFWQVVRTQDQIFSDIDGTEDGLVAWYLPSQGALNDYSGHNNHATLYGSPTFTDLANQDFTIDLKRKVKNAPLTWRYENAGDADDLILTAPILTDLPATKSKFGVAFYQTSRAKCFDLPATSDIWLKFDVYFDGSNRWRAYNDPSGGGGLLNGISAQQTSTSTGILSFFAETNQSIYQAENATKKNQLQTVLLHMVSDSSAGVVEAWVDGDFIYRYTGNVNNGEDFADIYLQSDGAGTFFSNVIISNAEIGLDEHCKRAMPVNFIADLQRNVTRTENFIADLQRTLVNPNEFSVDLQRRVVRTESFTADLQRKLQNYVDFTADLQRSLINVVDFTADLQRRVVRTESFTADLQRKLQNYVDFTADLQRSLINVVDFTADLQRRVKASMTGERMLSRISPIYAASTFMQHFFNALGAEWEPIRQYFVTLREQKFIQTVDWGIEYLEHKYSIVPDKTLTLEERRARLGIKAFNKRPLNPAVLEKAARELFGLEVYLDESDAGYIWIIATELTQSGYEGFMKFLGQEKPAHLALAFLLYFSEYIGTKDGESDLPKLHAGLAQVTSGLVTTKLSRPKNQHIKLWASITQITHGKVNICSPRPKSHLIKFYAGSVQIVTGTIFIRSNIQTTGGELIGKYIHATGNVD